MDLATVQAESQLDLGLQQGGDTNSAPVPGSGWTEYLASPGYTLLAGMLCGVIVNFITSSTQSQSQGFVPRASQACAPRTEATSDSTVCATAQ